MFHLPQIRYILVLYRRNSKSFCFAFALPFFIFDISAASGFFSFWSFFSSITLAMFASRCDISSATSTSRFLNGLDIKCSDFDLFDFRFELLVRVVFGRGPITNGEMKYDVLATGSGTSASGLTGAPVCGHQPLFWKEHQVSGHHAPVGQEHWVSGH